MILSNFDVWFLKLDSCILVDLFRVCANEFRDAEIFDLLQQRWTDFVRGSELKPADHKGVAVQGDINCNGFNSYR